MKDVTGETEEQGPAQSGGSTWLRKRGNKKFLGTTWKGVDERNFSDHVTWKKGVNFGDEVLLMEVMERVVCTYMIQRSDFYFNSTQDRKETR